MPLSTNAPFNEFGQSMILRDIEQLYLSLNATQATANSTNGNIDGGPGEGQTQDGVVGVSQTSGETPTVTGGGSDDPLTLGGDLSGTTDNATIVAGAVTKAKMENGTACSVIGRAANSAGVTADITASADNYILGRRSGVLTFAKVARAEMADGSACSVIGRSANSSGAVADISASDGTICARSYGGGAVAFSTNPIVYRDSRSLNLCMVSTITTSLDAPTGTAQKGELYFIVDS